MIPRPMYSYVLFSNTCSVVHFTDKAEASSKGRFALELYFSKNISHLVSE